MSRIAGSWDSLRNDSMETSAANDLFPLRGQTDCFNICFSTEPSSMGSPHGDTFSPLKPTYSPSMNMLAPSLQSLCTYLIRRHVISYVATCQDEGDYLCVKVLRHSKSKKTMVRQRFAALQLSVGFDGNLDWTLVFVHTFDDIERRCQWTF